MRLLAVLFCILSLAGCALKNPSASAAMLDDGTYKIEGPKIAYESDLPNQRKAAQVCPDGYDVLKRHVDRDGLGVNITTWIVDCY
jgi:hypothetical protein